jgi:hypothetical protein
MANPPASTDEQDPSTERQPSQRLNRALYLLVVASFFFPFATVKGCAGSEERTYTGLQLMLEDLGLLLVGVLVLAVLLFVFSFRRRILTSFRRILVQSMKALLCALAILTTCLASGMTFLLEPVREEIGFQLCLGSWIALYLIGMGRAIRQVVLARRECREPPPPWGLALCAVLEAAILATTLVSEPNGVGDVILGHLAGFMFVAPLVVLAMLAAVRYRLDHPGSHAA